MNITNIVKINYIKSIPGFLYGHKQHSVIFKIKVQNKDTSVVFNHLVTLKNVWAECFPDSKLVLPDIKNIEELGYWIYQFAKTIIKQGNLQSFDSYYLKHHIKIIRQFEFIIFFPLPLGQFNIAKNFVNGIQSLFQVVDSSLEENQNILIDFLKSYISYLNKFGSNASNTPRFLAAAYKENIPILPIGNHIYQYGHGCNHTIFSSSITSDTSAVAVNIARDKMLTNIRLHQAGLPTAKQIIVTNAQYAVNIANKMGYPVVIKPANSDGGQGVNANLTSDEEVEKAFKDAKRFSKSVILENHFRGRDYRLQIVDNELIWSIERIPAGIVGDGEHSIKQLVSFINKDPKRSKSKQSPLKQLSLDSKALHILKKYGYTIDSIPRKNESVPLRNIANIADGGTPIAVNEQVHPDNAHLAISAAKALELDLAGIDMIIPNISKSWKETGAIICEVNAQPQYGATTAPHIYSEILNRKLTNKGHIDIHIVLLDGEKIEFINSIINNKNSSKSYGFYFNKTVIFEDGTLKVDNIFHGTQVLFTNKSIDTVIFFIHDDSLLHFGLPATYFNSLCICTTHLKHHYIENLNPSKLFNGTVQNALLYCYGDVMCEEKTNLHLNIKKLNTRANILENLVTEATIVDKLTSV